MPEPSKRAWAPASALSLAVAEGAQLLLRPRGGAIAAARFPLERYFSADQLDRARRYERPQLRLQAANTLLAAAALVTLVRFRPGRPLGARQPADAAAGAAGLSLALTAQSLPLAALARARSLDAGLATQSWRGWWFDVLRGGVLGAAFAAGGGAVACSLVRRFGERWWVVGAGGSVAVAALANFAAPVLLDPIFNDFTPLPDGGLRAGVLELAEQAGVRVGSVYAIDASRRTRAVNAYVAGVGATRRVVLFDTLLERFTPAQTRAVVAHELAHVRHRDIGRGLAFVAAVAPVAARAVAALAERLDATQSRDGPGLPALVLAAALVSGVTGLPARQLSRAVERRADSFALELTGDPDSFIAFEQQITETNLADPRPPRWRSLLLATHPPAAERIGAALAYAAGVRPTPPRRRSRCRPRRP